MRLRHAVIVSLIIHLIFLAVLAKTGLLTKRLPEPQKGIIARLIGPEHRASIRKKPPKQKNKGPTGKVKVKRKQIKKSKSHKVKKIPPKAPLEKKTIPLPKAEKRTTPSKKHTASENKTKPEEGLSAQKGPVSKKQEPANRKEGQGGKTVIRGRSRATTGKAKGPATLGPGALFDRDVIGSVVKRSIERQKKKQSGGVTFSTRELKYHSYMMRLKERIESIWVYPQEAARRGIYGDLWISFTIKKDGTLGEVKLLRTSGYPELDRAAMKALRDGAPYWPLPEKWKIDALTVKGHFIYNLYGMYIR